MGRAAGEQRGAVVWWLWVGEGEKEWPGHCPRGTSLTDVTLPKPDSSYDAHSVTNSAITGSPTML